MKKEFAIICGN